MTARAMVLEHLVDANRALEELRSAATNARIDADRVAALDFKAPEEAAAAPALAARIEAWRQRIYADDLDADIVALMKLAAEAM